MVSSIIFVCCTGAALGWWMNRIRGEGSIPSPDPLNALVFGMWVSMASTLLHCAAVQAIALTTLLGMVSMWVAASFGWGNTVAILIGSKDYTVGEDGLLMNTIARPFKKWPMAWAFVAGTVRGLMWTACVVPILFWMVGLEALWLMAISPLFSLSYYIAGKIWPHDGWEQGEHIWGAVFWLAVAGVLVHD